MEISRLLKPFLCLLAVQILVSVEPIWAMSCGNALNLTKTATSSSAEVSSSLTETYQMLAKNGYLLDQGAAYIPDSCHGGICVSVSSINIMLAFAESLSPGRITNISPPGEVNSALQLLHINLLKSIFSKIEQVSGLDPRDGVSVYEPESFFESVFTEYFDLGNKTFQFGEGVKEVQDIESVGFDKTLVLGSVDHSIEESEGGAKRMVGHAIVFLGTQSGDKPSSFSFVVNDPHEVSDIKVLKVVGGKGDFRLESYGDQKAFGLLHFFETISLVDKESLTDGKTVDNSPLWGRGRLRRHMSEHDKDQKFRIGLSNGVDLDGVTIVKPINNKKYLSIRSRYSRTVIIIPYRTIETVEAMNDE